MTRFCRAVAALALAASSFSAAEANARPEAPAPSSAQCKILESRIRSSVMDMSATKAEDSADDSAPRGAMRWAEIGSEQTEIANYIQLMRANNCAPYTGSLDPDTYSTNALECHTAELRDMIKINAGADAKQVFDARTANKATDPCNRDNWQPMLK